MGCLKLWQKSRDSEDPSSVWRHPARRRFFSVPRTNLPLAVVFLWLPTTEISFTCAFKALCRNTLWGQSRWEVWGGKSAFSVGRLFHILSDPLRPTSHCCLMCAFSKSRKCEHSTELWTWAKKHPIWSQSIGVDTSYEKNRTHLSEALLCGDQRNLKMRQTWYLQSYGACSPPRFSQQDAGGRTQSYFPIGLSSFSGLSSQRSWPDTLPHSPLPAPWALLASEFSYFI